MYMADHWEEGILKAFHGVTYVAPSAVFVTLSSTDPGESGTAIVEPGYQGYARQRILFTDPGEMSGGIGMSNSEQIKFPLADSDQATCTYIALFDSESIGAGNMLAYAKLSTAKPIKAGQEPTLRVNEAKFWFTGSATKAFMTDILNTLRGISLPAITPYATLFNGSPDSGGSELVGGNFVRKLIALSEPIELSSGQRVVSNTQVVEFPVATQALGSYNTDVIYDREIAGKALFYYVGNTDNYALNDSVSYETGQIQIALN